MKMKCSVIQDLLPSYADNICSEDTRELVKEHVTECGQCKQKLEKMKNTEIVAGKASDKQVDYLKKIRGAIIRKEELGKIMLVILVGIAYAGLFTSGGLLDYPRIPSIIFSALILCAAILAGNYRFTGGKAAAAEIGVSGVVFAFVVSSFVYLVGSLAAYQAENEPILFHGLEAAQLGPLYANVLRIAAFIVMVLFLRNTFGKRKNAYATTLNIATVSYIAYANDWLYHMDSAETSVRYMRELTFLQLALAAAGICIYALLRKFGKVSGN